MSSFVISKKEFIKCAGFISAFAETNRPPFNEPILYVYSRKNNKLVDDEILKSEFTKLYEINAKSVAIQYNDEAVESDTNEYNDDFIEGKTYGFKTLRKSNAEIVRAVLDTAFFFDSIRYQIEDRDCEKTYFNIINKYYRAFYKVLNIYTGNHDELHNWGSFDI